MQEDSFYRKSLGYRYSYFSWVMGPSVPSDFHYMDGTRGFSNQFRVLGVNWAKLTYHMGTTWNINTRTFLKIWVVSLPSNSRPWGTKNAQFSLWPQDMFLLSYLIFTEWVSKSFVRATYHCMEQEIHLKTYLPSRSQCKDLNIL